MRYLTLAQVLLIHSLIIDETGGPHGVRDQGALSSAVALPQQVVFGRELYPTEFEKAAVYARSIIMNHPFVDGNKRTGMAAASVFLESNGYEVVAQEGEIESEALVIVREKCSIESIAAWFKKHARKFTGR
ncbi:MAG: type II toxin-antitoxin system death-on-curing family toxin [Candidatus Liptonbacteria bacterium]|nr:type II toxin-antitoxin system death-on-curing family toxin [Candidatus Liptonbacteria bacterium]